MVLLSISVKCSVNFLRFPLKTKRKLGSQSFSRSLFLMKAGGDEVNGKGRKAIDELLFFPTFHFGNILFRDMFLGQCTN